MFNVQRLAWLPNDAQEAPSAQDLYNFPVLKRMVQV
jgi:hypothetical protein